MNKKYMYMTINIQIYFLHFGQLSGSRGSIVGIGNNSLPSGSKKMGVAKPTYAIGNSPASPRPVFSSIGIIFFSSSEGIGIFSDISISASSDQESQSWQWRAICLRTSRYRSRFAGHFSDVLYINYNTDRHNLLCMGLPHKT